MGKFKDSVEPDVGQMLFDLQSIEVRKALVELEADIDEKINRMRYYNEPVTQFEMLDYLKQLEKLLELSK